MTPEQILKEAIKYQIEVSKWVKEVYDWHKQLGTTVLVESSNPPPPPPPPPGI